MHKKVVALALVFLILCACGTTPPGATEVEEAIEVEILVPEIVVAVPQLPTTIEPLSTGIEAVNPIYTALYEGLLTYKTDTGEIIPGLCESYTVSEDGCTYTFTLRQNALFSNGETITASNYVETFLHLIEDESSPLQPLLLDMIVGAAEYMRPAEGEQATPRQSVAVFAPVSTEFEVELTQPYPEFATMMTLTAFSPTYITPDGEQPPQIPVTCGPFAVETLSDQEAVVVATDYYYDSHMLFVDAIAFRRTGDDTSEQFSQSIVDIVMQPGEELLQSHTALAVDTVSFETATLALNNDASYTNRVLVREGFTETLDRNALTAALTIFDAVPATGLTPPGFITDQKDFSHTPERDAFPLSGDMTGALQALDAANYENGGGMSLRCVLLEGDPYNEAYELAIAQLTEKLNVRISVDILPQVEYDERIAKGDYHIASTTFGGGIVHPYALLHDMTSFNISNTAYYSDVQFDALVAQAGASVHRTRTVEILQNAEVLLYDDTPLLTLFHPTYSTLVHGDVLGYFLSPSGNLYLKNAFTNLV